MNVMLNNKAPHVLILGSFKLIPGYNQVPESIWETYCDHPTVHARMQGSKGVPATLEVVKLVSKGKLDSVSLKNIAPQMAIRIVENTYRMSDLTAWAREETRAPVLRKIDMQIGLLRAPPETNDQRDLAVGDE